MLFFLDQSSFGSLALEFAENLLLRETLLPEHNQSVNLLLLLDNFDALTSLPVKLIDEHLYKPPHVRETSQRACRTGG